MLDHKLMPYGTDTPEQLMNNFYKAGNDTLLSIRNFVVSPEIRKKPRTWGATEAAQMVGVSFPTFRKQLEKHNNNIPGIVTEKNENGRTSIKFTLETINFLREASNTRYKRPEGSKPLIIAVSNLKGGVGKTETAVDLG